MRAMFSNGRYANVTATLALVIALSGTSYAAITLTGKNIRNGTIQGVDLASNTVRGSNIRDGAVRNADVGRDAITSGRVRNGTLLSRDFKVGELPAGPTGPQGPVGPAGPAGVNAAANVTIRDGFLPDVSAGQATTLTVPCAANEKAVSGGLYSDSRTFSVITSVPAVTPGAAAIPTGWRVEAKNEDAVPRTLSGYAICAGP